MLHPHDPITVAVGSLFAQSSSAISKELLGVHVIIWCDGILLIRFVYHLASTHVSLYRHVLPPGPQCKYIGTRLVQATDGLRYSDYGLHALNTEMAKLSWCKFRC